MNANANALTLLQGLSAKEQVLGNKAKEAAERLRVSLSLNSFLLAEQQIDRGQSPRREYIPGKLGRAALVAALPCFCLHSWRYIVCDTPIVTAPSLATAMIILSRGGTGSPERRLLCVYQRMRCLPIGRASIFKTL